MTTELVKEIRDFADVDFLFSKHPITDNVTVKKNVNAIKQAIINLLTLRIGDKPFHPEIHSPIYKYLFDNFNVVTQVLIQDEIRNYLNVFEPRVEVLDVVVNINSLNPNDLQCTVVGKIINIQEPFSVSILIERLR